jgi:DNA polymerase III delta prime subunit
METYSKMTRFCLVCNYVTRIIDPLASRCSKFRFKSLDQENAVERVEAIAKLEGVSMDAGVSQELVRVAEGDLRKAITFLQSAARLVGATQAAAAGGGKKRRRVVDDEDDEDAMDVDEAPASTSSTITTTHIAEIAGVIPTPTLDTLIAAIFPSPSAKTTIQYNKLAKVVEDMVADGWSAAQTVGQLYERILFDERVGDLQKMRITGLFSETDKRLVDGGDEHLAVLDLGLRIGGVLCRA